MADILICSKDRAAQLDITLQSIYANFDLELINKIYVIYRATSEAYNDGYNILINKYYPQLEIQFMKQEGDLGKYMSYVFNKSSQEFMCIMTDDTIIYRPFSMKEWELKNVMEEDVLSFALRFGLNTQIINYSGEPEYEKPIKYDDLIGGKFLRWSFKQNQGGHFCYPFSCDGSFIRTADLRSITLNLQNNYRPFESHIVHSHLVNYRTYTISFQESVSLNVPINQTTEDLRLTDGVYFSQDPQEMNRLFLDGYRVRFDDVDVGEVNCCFKELLFTFVKDV